MRREFLRKFSIESNAHIFEFCLCEIFLKYQGQKIFRIVKFNFHCLFELI